MASMNLKTFRKSEKLTLDQMAARLGVSGATVQRWETGKMRPDWKHIPAIERATGGKVTAADFVPCQPQEAA